MIVHYRKYQKFEKTPMCRLNYNLNTIGYNDFTECFKQTLAIYFLPPKRKQLSKYIIMTRSKDSNARFKCVK